MDRLCPKPRKWQQHLDLLDVPCILPLGDVMEPTCTLMFKDQVMQCNFCLESPLESRFADKPKAWGHLTAEDMLPSDPAVSGGTGLLQWYVPLVWGPRDMCTSRSANMWYMFDAFPGEGATKMTVLPLLWVSVSMQSWQWVTLHIQTHWGAIFIAVFWQPMSYWVKICCINISSVTHLQRNTDGRLSRGQVVMHNTCSCSHLAVPTADVPLGQGSSAHALGGTGSVGGNVDASQTAVLS